MKEKLKAHTLVADFLLAFPMLELKKDVDRFRRLKKEKHNTKPQFSDGWGLQGFEYESGKTRVAKPGYLYQAVDRGLGFLHVRKCTLRWRGDAPVLFVLKWAGSSAPLVSFIKLRLILSFHASYFSFGQTIFSLKQVDFLSIFLLILKILLI